MRVVSLLVVVVAACGHTVRTGAGPLVDSRGNAGAVASVEVGTHLLGAKEVAMPIGVRAELAATVEGVQALIGFTSALSFPPGGRKGEGDRRRGWTGRIGGTTGALIESGDTSLGVRSSVALGRGIATRGSRDGGGCSGQGKMAWCYGWDRWRYTSLGVEVASTLRLVGDADGRGMSLDGWRASAELVYERGALDDLTMQ